MKFDRLDIFRTFPPDPILRAIDPSPLQEEVLRDYGGGAASAESGDNVTTLGGDNWTTLGGDNFVVK